jgi:hypothetical protein
MPCWWHRQQDTAFCDKWYVSLESGLAQNIRIRLVYSISHGDKLL